tara:strand:- start:54 stop:296 length:243 start_codon:yes stop_codon:yes gene_type:complete
MTEIFDESRDDPKGYAMSDEGFSRQMGDLADRARDQANYEEAERRFDEGLICESCGDEDCKLPEEEHILIPDMRQENLPW